MYQTLSFVFDLLCPRFSILPGSPLDFGALDKRIGQRAIARKNQCNLGKSCPSDSFSGLLHQAGAVESYTISSVFTQEMKIPSSAQLSVPVLQEAGNYTKAYRQQGPFIIRVSLPSCRFGLLLLGQRRQRLGKRWYRPRSRCAIDLNCSI